MILSALFILAAPLAAPLAAQFSLDSLRPGHPRLLASDQDIARIRQLIRTDPAAKAVYDRLHADAARILAQPPVEYKLIGPRLLDKSRTALGRIYTLALLYRLDGNTALLARAVAEMQAAAAFPDWNPSHFLDTAEMTHAFAIGYDWLYAALSKEQRDWIRAAIVDKGLEPALGFYENRRGWVLATHNWNQVCNGGISLGALAIAEDEPARAGRILRAAVDSIPRAMASYAPDGGWNEGPGYWDYATRYNVAFLAGLDSALGMDFKLSALPGFDRAGEFRVYFSSPAGRTFNYADAGDALNPAECMLWLARRFKQPVYAWQQLALLASRPRAHALDLVWWPSSTQSPEAAGWPLHKIYEGVQTAFFRGSWTDPNTMWAAAKGGDNKANHSHLDLGAFVLDSQGLRWALDFGPDDYNLPAYFGNKRWTYYRLRTEAHNTVLIDNENQDPKAEAKILRRELAPGRASVTFDLAAAYPGKLASHERTVTLDAGRTFTVRDQLAAPQPVEVLWGMVTDAEVRCDGAVAVLSKAGKSLTARLAAPAGARFETVSTQPPAPQRQNEGTRKLVVRLPAKVRQVTIEVAMTDGVP
ncbi:MAG: heparinase II/III family protein [Candidatus Solibacter usitatus]|nr:heparinase II/III family protein [Candidatus Solibacter usitatus]